MVAFVREIRRMGYRVLAGSIGKKSQEQGQQQILLNVEYQAVFHIAKSFLSANRPMMTELRNLKRVLAAMGFIIKAEWLPSVANKFADGLLRSFPRGDLPIRRQLRSSVVGGTAASKDAFTYRPLGENPFIRLRQAFDELSWPWEPDSVRVLCPPVELIAAKVSHLI